MHSLWILAAIHSLEEKNKVVCATANSTNAVCWWCIEVTGICMLGIQMHFTVYMLSKVVFMLYHSWSFPIWPESFVCRSGMSQCIVLQAVLRLTALARIRGLRQLSCVRALFAFYCLLPKPNHTTACVSSHMCYLGCSSPSCLQTKLANGTSSMIVPKQRKLSASYEKEKELCVKYFEQWSESDQVEFVEHLISQMCHYQHGHINSYLKPMLQRDFITALPGISAGRGSLLPGFQKTILFCPTLLERSLVGSVCKTDNNFWMKSSIPVWNVVIF